MFSSNFFWFAMGMLAILIGVGFNVFAQDRGWVMNWWKWLLAIVWYAIFSISIYASGTLLGENEQQAALWMGGLGLFISLIFAVGLWRLFAHGAKKPEVVEATATPAEA
jgi:hypothetical protein